MLGWLDQLRGVCDIDYPMRLVGYDTRPASGRCEARKEGRGRWGGALG